MSVQCIAPEEIEDGDLLAFASGQASGSVVDHVGRCEYCGLEVKGLTAMEKLIQAAVYRQSCPDSQSLLAYSVADASSASQTKLRLHIDTCAHCQAELALFEAEEGVTETKETILDRIRKNGRRLLEAISVPTLAQPALALRGDNKPPQYFEVGDYQIVIMQEATFALDDMWQITGKIRLKSDPPATLSGTVTLLHDGQSIATDIIDEYGHFGFVDIPSASYQLCAMFPFDTVQILGMTVK